MMIVSAGCPFLTTGSRKACTPLLTAFTPVIAVCPLENARGTSCTPAAATEPAFNGGGATIGAGVAPESRAVTTPHATMAVREAIKT
jgi:hypothetical protein